jgi:hypothetical protein
VSQSGFELRPLSIGDILDRTFLLYRRYFPLFLGITAIPQVLVLAWNLARTLTASAGNPTLTLALGAYNVALTFLGLILAVMAYLFAQGATVLAVSELYLGKSTSISASLKRVWDDFGPLFGVIALNGLVVGFGFLLLVIPGIYLMCRLLVCVPAALIENRGPRESLGRAFDLTRANAGRAFVIVLFSTVLTYAAIALFVLPFTVAATLTAAHDPNKLRLYTALMTQISTTVASILVTPVTLIATSIFYYDLRVRKEGFDLEFMMNPDAPQAPRSIGPPYRTIT